MQIITQCPCLHSKLVCFGREITSWLLFEPNSLDNPADIHCIDENEDKFPLTCKKCGAELHLDGTIK